MSPPRRLGSAAPRRPAPRKKPRRSPAAPSVPIDNPAAKALAQRAAALMLDKKASEVVSIDVRGLTSYTDYVVIGSGDSERQVSAMAENVREALKAEGQRLLGSEGYASGHWVLLDYGEVVVHLFLDELRTFYDLEGLWTDAPRDPIG